MNLNNRSVVQEFFELLGSKRDAVYLARLNYTVSMVRDMPESMINSFEVEGTSKIYLLQRKRELIEEAQALKEKEKSIRDRKPKLQVPPFDPKDILLWVPKSRQHLTYEKAESSWFDFLQASLDLKYMPRVQQALEEKDLDSSKPWSDNERHFLELFLPSFARINIMSQVLALRPKPGETFPEYSSRFEVFLIYSDKIEGWFFAEAFVMSLPEYLQKEIKRLDPHTKEYPSIAMVRKLALEALASNPNKHLVPIGASSSSQTSSTNDMKRKSEVLEVSGSTYCTRCHNTSHTADTCHAKRTKEGNFLPEVSSNNKTTPLKLLGSSSSSSNPVLKKQIPVHVVESNSVQNTEEMKEVDADPPDENDVLPYFLEDVNAVVVEVLLNRHQLMEKEDLLKFPMIIGQQNKEFALLDSGASASLLSNKFVSSWAESVQLKDEPNIVVRSFAGNKFSVKSILTQVQTSNNNEPFIHKFLVVDMEYPIICGIDLIHRCKIQINNVPFQFPLIPKTPTVHVVELMKEDEFLVKYGVDKAIKANLERALLACSHPSALIQLDVDETKMKFIRQYPIAEIYKSFVDKQVDKWETAGIIEKASISNRWNNPLWTVPKYLPSGEIDTSTRRVCLDARFINEALISDDRFPVPIISDIFNDIAGACLFSEADGESAYTQFEIAVESRKYLGFTWNNQHYQFTRAIYGLKFMSSRFQRVIQSILAGLHHTRGYIDNILTFTKTLDLAEHANCCIETLNRLTEYNITINPSKCKWAKMKLRVLGHEISSEGIAIDPVKITFVDNLQIPTTGDQLRSHLGLFNYFRSFIPLYSKTAAPLEIIKNQIVLNWTQTEQQAFDQLRNAIKNAPILMPPDPKQEMLVATDASDHGLGAVLYQQIDDKIRYIQFASRALVGSERNYSATKLELSAVIFALEKFEFHILLKPFTVFTDHSALVSLFKSKFTYQILTNEWYERIIRFAETMKIVHCPGVDNVLPDLLSRCYKKNESANSVEQNPNVSGALQLADALHLKTVIDETQKQELMSQAHSLGHFGSRNVQALIMKEGFYWVNMSTDIANFIQNCEECQIYKISREGFHPMRSLDAVYPFEMIAMDLCGPLPLTQHKNRFILVVVDVATRFCLLRAISDKFATTIATELVLIMTEFGLVKILLSDNGTEFVNSILNEIKKVWAIDKRTITPYYPQGNGITENKVKNVKTILEKLVSAARKQTESIKQWDLILPMVEMILNIKPNDTTKTSPFELFFGRPYVGFQDFTHSIPNILTQAEIQQRWKKIHEIVFPAVRKLRQSAQKSTALATENSRNVIKNSLKQGTVVMFEIDGLRGRMKKKMFDIAYQGPCIIERQNKAGNYVLREMSSGNIIRARPLSQLKVLQDVVPEKILSMRTNPITGEKKYKIQFTDKHSVWIDESSPLLSFLQEGKGLSTSSTSIPTVPIANQTDQEIVDHPTKDDEQMEILLEE